MQIQIIPNDYSNANELTTTIKRVIMQHPLIDSSMSGILLLANKQKKHRFWRCSKFLW